MESRQNKMNSLMSFLDEVEESIEVERRAVEGLWQSESPTSPLAQTKHEPRRTTTSAERDSQPLNTKSRGISVTNSTTMSTPNRLTSSSALPSHSSTSPTELKSPPMVNVASSNSTTSSGGATEGIRSKLAALKQELAAQRAAVVEKDKVIEHLRAREAAASVQFGDTLRAELSAQKKEFETVIQRQITFITKLVNDKEELTKRTEQLMTEAATMQKKVQKQLEDQAAQMATTLKRQKEAWAAAEKVRREAWQEEKTARIKELTIKGLQPELQKVIDKAKSDLHAAHEQAAEAQRALREELLLDAAREREIFRRQCQLEAEKAIDEERQRNAQRLQELVSRNDDIVQETRRRTLDQCATDIRRLQEEHTKEIALLKEQVEKQQSREANKVTQVLEEAKRKHDHYVLQLKEQEKLEREQWINVTLRKLQREAAEQIDKAKEQLAKERNEELDLVIARLGQEAADAQRKAVLMYEEKLQDLSNLRRIDNANHARVEESLRAEISEWQRKNQELQDRWEISHSKATSTQLSLHEKTREANTMTDEIKRLRDILDRETKAHEKALEDARIAGARAKELELQSEKDRAVEDERKRGVKEKAEALEEVETRKAKELDDLHERVKRMLAKKDTVIVELKDALEEAKQRLKRIEEERQLEKEELIREMG